MNRARPHQWHRRAWRGHRHGTSPFRPLDQRTERPNLIPRFPTIVEGMEGRPHPPLQPKTAPPTAQERHRAAHTLHAENGSPAVRQRMADVACTLCVSTGTRDVHVALVAARHQLPGARPQDDSLLTAGRPRACGGATAAPGLPCIYGRTDSTGNRLTFDSHGLLPTLARPPCSEGELWSTSNLGQRRRLGVLKGPSSVGTFARPARPCRRQAHSPQGQERAGLTISAPVRGSPVAHAPSQRSPYGTPISSA